jgi:hypothetical protein
VRRIDKEWIAAISGIWADVLGTILLIIALKDRKTAKRKKPKKQKRKR